MFRNEPLIDFTVTELREGFQKALNDINQEIKSGMLYAAPIISGNEIKNGQSIKSIDPSTKAISIGEVFMASEKLALEATEVLANGSESWFSTDPEERASIIEKAGQIMREKKMRLAAIIVREVGKPWKEADADVAEAIDFCLFYAEEMRRLAKPQRTQEVPGEDNFYLYQPRGLALIIAPWNFPLAIACGMAVAALVAGNVTILKPAEQSSIIAMEFAKILLLAGVPQDAFAFLPGDGEVVGRTLVSHPKIDLICFTGSKAVGLEIIKSAAVVHPGQKNIKKVIAELGGKNAIIIDDDADLDEAIKGVLQSTFGFAGQKCSACSRAIIVGTAYEPFLQRLKEAVKDIIVGESKDSSTFLGPVIDEEARKRILLTIDEAQKKHAVLFRGNASESGFFVPPTIFRDVDTSSSLWREEIFGPVLACTLAKDFDTALSLANESSYALTGGLYSRNPAHIHKAKQKFRVGNLYINRTCTGALVCRQPFGGFRMSGVGSKAGGPDYLIQFMEPRTITENTMRRGFAPS